MRHRELEGARARLSHAQACEELAVTRARAEALEAANRALDREHDGALQRIEDLHRS